ncbi:MAG: hypothetical protein AAF721_09500 [Myxococcota bacterium]
MPKPYAGIGTLALTVGCGGALTQATEDDQGDTTHDADTAADDASVDADSDADADDGVDDGSGGADASDDGAPEPGPWDAGWPIPPSEQVPGDIDSGYWAMLNEGYVTCGIPFSIFDLVSGALGSFASGDPLPGRTGPNAEVPYNWTVHVAESGAEIASLNCLECHAGEFNGELIVGLGKADADYTGDVGGSLAQLPVPSLEIPGIEELTEMMERYQAIGDDIKMLTVGTNPADKLAAVLASHRDRETLEWFDEPQFVVPDFAVPVDTPPWWRVAKKNAMFWNGMARGDHRGTMMFASSLCTDSIGEAESILTIFNNINAYLRSLEAPKYPFAIDTDLAAEGEVLFNRDCGGCHGTYNDDPALETYPNLLLPLDVVGTDPLIAGQAAEQPFVGWYNDSWYGDLSPLSPDDPFPGYVAPPLDGIWATAPFFHNGSVPNLAMVLDATIRPEHWRRVDYDSANFDEGNVGWPFIATPYNWDDAPADEQKHVYDTSKLGHWNTGHDFGDHLTVGERTAVLEYLKTL